MTVGCGVPRVSVVVPVRNESAGLGAFVAALRDALGSAKGQFEVIFVDDGSTDTTWKEIVGQAGADSRVKGIRLSRNFGKEAALFRGLEASTGMAVVTMDGDLEHPPVVIPRMLEMWEGGAKIVNAVRADRSGRSFIYRAASALFDGLMGWMTGFRVRGATDFKVLDRQVVEAVLSLPERSTFFRGICAWVGFESAEVPFEVPSSPGRQTRWQPLALVRLALDALTSFSAAPLWAFGFAGGAFLAAAAVLGLQTLFNYLAGRALTGFTTVILVSLAVGGMNLLGVSVIGLYLSRVFTETKLRPRSLVSEAVGLGAWSRQQRRGRGLA
jgi:glycosyltransferase involved in cell wall biosynthesis